MGVLGAEHGWHLEDWLGFLVPVLVSCLTIGVAVGLYESREEGAARRGAVSAGLDRQGPTEGQSFLGSRSSTQPPDLARPSSAAREASHFEPTQRVVAGPSGEFSSQPIVEAPSESPAPGPVAHPPSDRAPPLAVAEAMRESVQAMALAVTGNASAASEPPAGPPGEDRAPRNTRDSGNGQASERLPELPPAEVSDARREDASSEPPADANEGAAGAAGE